MRKFLLPRDITFSIVVRNRAGVVYEGEAYALSSYNAKGAFDVLPLHTNFISLIKTSIHIYKKDGVEEELPIDTGVLYVKKNKVEVYLGILY